MPYLYLIFFLLFMGCSSKELYTLGDTTSLPQETRYSTEIIAVETITLPTYLKDSPIYKKDSPTHFVELSDAKWVNNMESQLTQSLINYLQKAQNNANIYAYPWENLHKPLDKKISTHITSFIAYGNRVILEGNYQINLPKQKRAESYLFSISEPILGIQSQDIVEAMEKAFFKLADEINLKV